MSFFVHVLMSLKTRRFYVGQTNDLADRLHNEGRVRSTEANAPWSMVYFEKYETRAEAMKRERELKSFKGTAKFLELVGVAKRHASRLHGVQSGHT